MHLLVGQTRLDDKYKNPDELPKVNMADMAGMIEFIEEYLRSCHGVVRVSLAYINRKTKIFQNYGDYPRYVTLDDEMIAKILHLFPDMNKLHNKQSAQSVTVLPVGKSVPIGHQFLQCHMVFDIKMEDFRRKARLVAGNHMTETPDNITYASIVSREACRKAMIISPLNDLRILNL